MLFGKLGDREEMTSVPFLKDKEYLEIDGQWKGMDGTDMGKEDLPDFSDVPGKHISMSLTTLTHLGNCRCLGWKGK